jgi:GDP-mannose 4,6-dehydratase
MKAFITGITGMVGSHLTDYLLKNTNWDVYGYCRWNDDLNNIRHLSEKINKKDRVDLLYGDLNDYASVFSSIKSCNPDYIFHLAAQSYPKTSFNAPLETLQTNIIGTAHILESARALNLKCPIHICASSEIFGRVKKDQLPISEECSMHPASPYAISKVGTDLLGRYYGEAYNMCVMTTRMFTHTGPRRGDVFAESTFAKQIAMIEADLQEPVIKVGNLDSLRTWSDVRDAVKAYYLLVTKNPIPGEYYNIGGDYSCSVRDMLNYLLSISKRKDIKVKVESSRLRPIDADLQIPNTEKFRNHTGWKPEIKFETTMKDLLEYWRERVRKEKHFLCR